MEPQSAKEEEEKADILRIWKIYIKNKQKIALDGNLEVKEKRSRKYGHKQGLTTPSILKEKSSSLNLTHLGKKNNMLSYNIYINIFHAQCTDQLTKVLPARERGVKSSLSGTYDHY